MLVKYSLLFLIPAILIKLIAIYFTNFDLFGDEAQYWIWSQKIDYGYFSKPPLLSWIIAGFSFFFGNSFEALKIIPIIFYFFTSYTIYLLSYELYKDKYFSIVVSLSFYLLPAVSVSSFLLSTDVVLIFFWSLSLWILIKIQKKPIFLNFLLLGIFLGLSFLAKYAAVYFLISLLLCVFFDEKIRKVFLDNVFNSMCFLFTVFLIVLPNILWNLNNQWVTFDHTSDNIGFERVGFNFFQGLEFLLTQAVMMGPVLFFSFVFLIKKNKLTFQTKFLLFFSVPIFFIVFVESVLVRANANWAAVAIVPFFILAINSVYNYSKKLILFNSFVNFVFCVVFFLLIALSTPYSFFNRINGISLFAEKLHKDHLNNSDYLIIDDRLLYSSLVYQYKNKNIKILSPFNPEKKIQNHFNLSNPLIPHFNKNFILIGNPEAINYLTNKYKIIQINSVEEVFTNKSVNVYEVIF